MDPAIGFKTSTVVPIPLPLLALLLKLHTTRSPGFTVRLPLTTVLATVLGTIARPYGFVSPTPGAPAAPPASTVDPIVTMVASCEITEAGAAGVIGEVVVPEDM